MFIRKVDAKIIHFFRRISVPVARFGLFVIPSVTWSGMMVPTMEGQYIIKNLVIIAAAIVIAAHLHPLKYKVATTK